MNDKNGHSILMNQFINQKANRVNYNNTHQFVSPASPSQLKVDVWSQGKESDLESHEQSSTRKKRNLWHIICSPKCNACLLGLIAGSLLVGIGLAVVLTISLTGVSTTTSPSTASSQMVSIITTTSTTTITSTSTTSTTTTTQASAIAYSSLTSYCGCSGFKLSLGNTSFSTSSVTYQWQSSPTGQNIWSNINISSSLSTLSFANQLDSTDYQCQIYVLSPSPINVTSTVVTVMTTTNISYCQTRFDDCTCCGDDIDNFILIGESGTQIYDIGTGCSALSYDNRTQQSVTLYQNMNYTAQVTTEYSGGANLLIWIDFNDNFQFETSEQVASVTRIHSYNTSVIINIPSSVAGGTAGVHRMRATSALSGVPTPCGTSSPYGETHDYIVNILSSSG